MTEEWIARDILRHAFSERELRVLFLILFEGNGAQVTLDRKLFEERLGLRSDKVLIVLRDLFRCRVIKKGWEDWDFVIECNADLWKREELASRAVLAQSPLELPSQDAGVQFEQALAVVDLQSKAAGVLPAPGPGACCPVLNEHPQFGEKIRTPDLPQNGENARGGPSLQYETGLPNLGSTRVKVPNLPTCISALMERVAFLIQNEQWLLWGKEWRKAAVGFEEQLGRAIAFVEPIIRADWPGRRRGKFVWKTFQSFMSSPKNVDEALAYCAPTGINPAIARIWFDEMEAMGWQVKGEEIRVWQKHLSAYAAKWRENEHRSDMRYEKRHRHTNQQTRQASDPNRGFAPGARERTRSAVEVFRQACASGGSAA